MGRANRIIFEGAIYHIIMRGNNREYIFNNPKHKSFLLKQLKEYNKVLDFDLLSYVIMDNHYHLVVKTNKEPISEVMFYINNVLDKYLSRELNRTGHIFQKRYICKLVTTDMYLVWLLRYLHRNPIRAGICTSIDEYRWTRPLPYGGEDMDKFEGDIRLTTAVVDEEFIPLGTDEDSPPYEGEIVYKDDKGAICRCSNWREAVRIILLFHKYLINTVKFFICKFEFIKSF